MVKKEDSGLSFRKMLKGSEAKNSPSSIVCNMIPEVVLLLTPRAEVDVSDSEISDSTSRADDNVYVESSVATSPTPFSPKASPRHPSDLKTLQCPYGSCDKLFNRPAKLSQHLRSHTNTRPFICPDASCTKDFLRESHLKHHLKSAHSNIRDHVCEWEGCGKSFITATRLRRHYAAHEGREKFKCTAIGCEQTFRKHGTLQKHVATVHEGRHLFVCQLANDDGTTCGVGFDTQGRMESHAGRIHGMKKFLCTICRSQQVEGVPNPHPNNNSTAFPSHAALQAHVQSEHPPICIECGLKCSSKSALKSHVEVLHASLEVNERRIHVCSQADCGRAFTKKGNLNAHFQISHAGKRFVCGGVDPKTLNHVGNWDGSDACGETSTSKRNLERHICTIHLGLDASGKFKRKEKHRSRKESACNNHGSSLARLTGSGYDTETGRNIVCLVEGCSHRFIRHYDLEIHLHSCHGLADPEIQKVMTGQKLHERLTFQRTPMYATDQELGAERVLDMQFGNDIAMEDPDGSFKAESLGNGGIWFNENLFGTTTGDPWVKAEMTIQRLIDQGHDDIERHAAPDGQNVVMIDPSLQ